MAALWQCFPGIYKACRSNKPSVQTFFWCTITLCCTQYSIASLHNSSSTCDVITTFILPKLCPVQVYMYMYTVYLWVQVQQTCIPCAVYLVRVMLHRGEIPWDFPFHHCTTCVYVICNMLSLSPSSMSSRSPVAVQQSRPAADSSSHTSPSSADTPSDSTVQSVGAVNADTSDKDSSSFTVEFRDNHR